MKTLTIRQPWAWAILHAGKNIENRTWSINYRGPLLIHAGKGKQDFSRANFAKIEQIYGEQLPTEEIDHQRGKAIAIANLIDIVRLNPNDPRFHPWAIEEQFHWIFANVTAIEPVSAKGSLGLWDLEIAPVKLHSRNLYDGDKK